MNQYCFELSLTRKLCTSPSLELAKQVSNTGARALASLHLNLPAWDLSNCLPPELLKSFLCNSIQLKQRDGSLGFPIYIQNWTLKLESWLEKSCLSSLFLSSTHPNSIPSSPFRYTQFFMTVGQLYILMHTFISFFHNLGYNLQEGMNAKFSSLLYPQYQAQHRTCSRWQGHCTVPNNTASKYTFPLCDFGVMTKPCHGTKHLLSYCFVFCDKATFTNGRCSWSFIFVFIVSFLYIVNWCRTFPRQLMVLLCRKSYHVSPKSVRIL